MIIIKQNRDKIKKLAEHYGYLPYMIRRYFDFLGPHETIELLKANENPPKIWIRINSLKITPKEIANRLSKKGFDIKKSEWLSYAFKIQEEPLNIGALHEYLQGYYYIQHLVSMLPAKVLNPDPQDTVIDMCASPGGKATHLAQLMENKGKLYLIERNPQRIPALRLNIRRMGVANSIILEHDAKQLNNLNLKADKILLDAPCTGEGLIREDPTRKTSRSLDDIRKLADIQKKLLSAGLRSLKKGGILLYSTCSIAPEENELVVDEVLNKNSNIKIVEIDTQYGIPGFREVFGNTLRPDLENAQRFFPHRHDTIGFFICLLQKTK